jgi:uncharacterized protein YwgA
VTLFDALLTTLEAEGGSIRGRTLLQKKLYFLSVLTGEDFGFAPYYYGPYSSAVSAELETLVGAGFVEERKERLGASGGGPNEPKEYRYTLTDDGTAILPEIVQDRERYRAALARINGHSVAQSSRLLSIAAKIHVVGAGDGTLLTEEIATRAKHLGWDLPPHAIPQAQEYLTSLGLARADLATATYYGQRDTMILKPNPEPT